MLRVLGRRRPPPRLGRRTSRPPEATLLVPGGLEQTDRSPLRGPEPSRGRNVRDRRALRTLSAADPRSVPGLPGATGLFARRTPHQQALATVDPHLPRRRGGYGCAPATRSRPQQRLVLCPWTSQPSERCESAAAGSRRLGWPSRPPFARGGMPQSRPSQVGRRRSLLLAASESSAQGRPPTLQPRKRRRTWLSWARQPSSARSTRVHGRRTRGLVWLGAYGPAPRWTLSSGTLPPPPPPRQRWRTETARATPTAGCPLREARGLHAVTASGDVRPSGCVRGLETRRSGGTGRSRIRFLRGGQIVRGPGQALMVR